MNSDSTFPIFPANSFKLRTVYHTEGNQLQVANGLLIELLKIMPIKTAKEKKFVVQIAVDMAHELLQYNYNVYNEEN